MIFNQLLTKAANSDVEEVGIQDEFLSQGHDGKYRENPLHQLFQKMNLYLCSLDG